MKHQTTKHSRSTCKDRLEVFNFWSHCRPLNLKESSMSRSRSDEPMSSCPNLLAPILRSNDQLTHDARLRLADKWNRSMRLISRFCPAYRTWAVEEARICGYGADYLPADMLLSDTSLGTVLCLFRWRCWAAGGLGGCTFWWRNEGFSSRSVVFASKIMITILCWHGAELHTLLRHAV